jgi:hypothetical protein
LAAAWYSRGLAAGRGVSDNGEYFESGTFHGRRYFDLDVTALLRAHDALVELVAAPRLLSVLQATVGADVQATTIQARVLPPQSPGVAAAEGGYVGSARQGAAGVLGCTIGGHPFGLRV